MNQYKALLVVFFSQTVLWLLSYLLVNKYYPCLGYCQNSAGSLMQVVNNLFLLTHPKWKSTV